MFQPLVLRNFRQRRPCPGRILVLCFFYQTLDRAEINMEIQGWFSHERARKPHRWTVVSSTYGETRGLDHRKKFWLIVPLMFVNVGTFSASTDTGWRFLILYGVGAMVKISSWNGFKFTCSFNATWRRDPRIQPTNPKHVAESTRIRGQIFA